MDRAKALRGGGEGFKSRRSVSWIIRSNDGPGEDATKEDAQAGRPPSKPPAAPAPPAGDGLGKEIGLLYGGSLVLNAIIGPGIFGNPKGVVASVGSVGMCMVMWVFAGLFSMCAALCFAELRESVKREGVEYAYITEAFGPLVGFVYSWMRIAAAEPCSTAVFALAFADYVSDVIFDDCGPPQLFVSIVATIATVSMALVNVMSSKLSERVQMLASVGKLAALSTVVVIGIQRMIDGETEIIKTGFTGSKFNPTALGMACFNSLWSFGGWTNVNQVTSGIRKPPRNVPRVIKFILPLVLVLYILTVLSFFTTMTPAELVKSQAIGVTWAERVLGPASSLITVSVGLICLGSVNATFLSAGRLSGVAARNNQMPDVVSWVHVSSKSPLISVCFRCVVAIVLVCVATGQELLRFGMFTVWLFHGSSALALLILRFKNKDKKRPYKVDLWIPVVVVVVTCFLLLSPFLQVPERTFIVALVLIALSLLSYHPINWLKSKEAINVPDKLIIWLQLFFRVAPKRDLRREKRSMMRRMSMFARDSILITPNVIQSPEQMRRFSRRMSRMSRRGRGGPVSGSPALIRRLAELEKESVPDGLRRRNRRGSSMAEADGGAGMKRWRSNSMWAFQTDSKPSPAIIRKKPNRGSHSFSPADIKNLVSPPSLPILKNRFNTTPEATVGSAPGELAPPNGALQHPHSVLRPVPSPIPEEDLNALATTASEDVNRFEALGYPPHAPPQAHTDVPDSGDEEDDEGDEVEENLEEEAQSENALQVVADFESDGGGEYEVLAPASEARRISLGQEELSDDGESDFVSTCSSEDDSVSSIKSHESFNMFKSLFAADSSSPGTSSTDDSDDDMVDEDLPTLPMHYYNKDESASECSGSGSDNWTNEGYVDNEDGVPTKVPRRKPVEGEDGGAEGAGWDNGEANGKEGVESKPEPVAGWHVNSAFYLNMEDEDDGRDAKFATGTPASEDALTEDGGIQVKPVHFHPGSSGGDSKV